ncbi:putative inactive receptor kinase [Camellia lanceoleosa]|uniref:Inactive receptor kinase n=1 Tax=Camellia lanceoleosa TaxID=1840588 RepID=A0ACC0H7Z2_9ERIC|nr:putative inactive receptor kinase [Camellia lanceoleosa]
MLALLSHRVDSEPSQDKQALLAFISQIPHANCLQWNASDSACNWVSIIYFNPNEHRKQFSTFLETSSSATAVATVPPSQSPPSSASPSRSRSPSPPPALRSHPNPYSLRSRHRNKKPSGSRTSGVRTLSDLNSLMKTFTLPERNENKNQMFKEKLIHSVWIGRKGY